MSLNFPFKKSSSGLSDLPDKALTDNDFSYAINLFKTQRHKTGISLEQLSKETKISRNVLIAIENGWRKYLPETTYLISMVKSLEIKLNLKRGSLDGAKKISIELFGSLAKTGKGHGTDKSILIGGTFANLTESSIQVSVEVYDNSAAGTANSTSLLASDIPIPAGSSFVISEAGKTVIEQDDQVRVYCDTANAVDVNLAILSGVS